jgi:hypothetical protein
MSLDQIDEMKRAALLLQQAGWKDKDAARLLFEKVVTPEAVLLKKSALR